MIRPLNAVFFAVLLAGCAGRTYQLEPAASGSNASFRALSVVDDSVAWVAGSRGSVGRSTDGGRTWQFRPVAGHDSLDFRTLHAFDAQTAVIANAGSPAHILRTTDAGASWSRVHTDTRPEAFIDGVDFWDASEGIMYGDPVGDRMLLLRTTDGGVTWSELPDSSRPVLADQEYSFAASGTGIRCLPGRSVVISTGGMTSRLWRSDDGGVTWRSIAVPVIQGGAATGIFSFTFITDRHAVVVGGDYTRDTLATDHVLVTRNGGTDWSAPAVPTRGYRECVELIGDGVLVAAGPTGIDLSTDGGARWRPFSDLRGFHVVRKARTGSLVVAAGGDGQIALIR